MAFNPTLNKKQKYSRYQTTNLLKIWLLFLVSKKKQGDKSELVTKFAEIIVTVIISRIACKNIPEKWDLGHGTSTGGIPGSGSPKCLGGILDAEPPKWDRGHGTPKYSSGARVSKISKWNPGLQIFYSFNRLFYT